MRAFEGVEQDSVKMQNCPSVLFSFWCSPGRSYRRLGLFFRKSYFDTFLLACLIYGAVPLIVNKIIYLM